MAPNSSRIAYRADPNILNDFQLYTTFPCLTPSILVSGPIAAVRNVEEFSWAPDSCRIAYLADQDIDDVFELYSADPAPIAGPDFVKVCAPLGVGQNVEEFTWAPNSSLIVSC